MSGSVVLLHLAGAVALMLFATRMVQDRRRARLWRRAAPPAARHHAQSDHGGAGRLRPVDRPAELDRRHAAGRLLRRRRHRQRHVGPACRARRRDRLGAGGQAADLRPHPAGADLPGRRHDDVHGHRAARLAAVRPHPGRHRPAGAVAGNDRPGVRAAAPEHADAGDRRLFLQRSGHRLSAGGARSPGCSIPASRPCCCW